MTSLSYQTSKLTRKYLWESSQEVNRVMAALPDLDEVFAGFEASPTSRCGSHDPAYTRLVLEQSATIPDFADARAFAKHFVSKPSYYSNTKVGKSALRMETWIRQHGGLIAKRFVELIYKDSDATYLIVLEGKISENEFKRFEAAVAEFASLKALVSAGDINTERGTVSDVTIYEVTPKAAAKTSKPKLQASDLTPPNDPPPTGFNQYPGSASAGEDDDLKMLERLDEVIRPQEYPNWEPLDADDDTRRFECDEQGALRSRFGTWMVMEAPVTVGQSSEVETLAVFRDAAYALPVPSDVVESMVSAVFDNYEDDEPADLLAEELLLELFSEGRRVSNAADFLPCLGEDLVSRRDSRIVEALMEAEDEDGETTDRTNEPEFYRDDLQDYYDALMVMGIEKDDALSRLKTRFKLRQVEVTVTGEVRAKGIVDNPAPKLAVMAPPADTASEAPPADTDSEAPPAEESLRESRYTTTGGAASVATAVPFPGSTDVDGRGVTPGVTRGGKVSGIQQAFDRSDRPGSPEYDRMQRALRGGDTDAARLMRAYTDAMRRITAPVDPDADPKDTAADMVAEFGRLLGMEESEELEEGMREWVARGKKFLSWATKTLEKAKAGLEVEKVETKEMVTTLVRLLKSKLAHRISDRDAPTEAEIRKALEQLKDVGKVAVVATVLLGPLPGDEPLLLALEFLAQRFGMSLFPSAMQGMVSFRESVEVDARSFEEYMAESFPDLWESEPIAEAESTRSLTEPQRALYERWKRLVNMTAESIRHFLRDTTLVEVLKKHRKNKTEGIRRGVAESRRLLAMKSRPVEHWDEGMWRAAKRQVQFIEMTRRNSADLFDDLNRPTRKVYTLRAWGHDPVVRESINEASFIFQQRGGDDFICPHCHKQVAESSLRFHQGMWEHSCGGALGLSTPPKNVSAANRWLDATPGSAPYYIGSLDERTPSFAVLREGRSGLDGSEKSQVKDLSVGVWKSVTESGDSWYVANTHRAYTVSRDLGVVCERTRAYLAYT